jgi:diguanylate cyclase (GGDEF)-like protein
MFNLSRYFSLLSLALIAAASVLLLQYYRHNAMAQLLALEQSRAAEFTQLFENSLWSEFKPLVDAARPGDTPELLRRRAQASGLHEALAAMARNTTVIKVKIYAPAGMTVFSTDAAQIGDDKSDNPGFRAAIAGQASGALTHRNTFDAFEGALSDRDIIFTYVPIHDPLSNESRIEGVFEVYQDVTGFVRQADRQLAWITATVLGVFAALYLAQFIIVRHAQRILRGQAEALEQANGELDRRVQERTRELELEVAERRRAQQRLDHLAHHDPLTGLPNRILFRDRLTQRLQRLAAAPAAQAAVLFIDLDRFKDVNDTLGHPVGDALLTSVTRRLQLCVGEGDTLARVGGDEFICLLGDIRDPQEAEAMAQRLLDIFREPFTVGANRLHLSASIGISLAPGDGREVDELVRQADAAMYQAKAQGRNRCHFYTAAMTAQAQERIELEGRLRTAIGARELSLHYQPKIDIASGRLTGAEALLRWYNVELGTVPPARFIPVAEETGFIEELGAWALDEACRQLADWDGAGLHVPMVSINLSVRQLERGNFPGLLQDCLRRWQVSPQRVEIEITESVVLVLEDAFSRLAELQTLGVRLALDDFGTGYSSLSYLNRLPVQALKIDRSFVSGIGVHRSDESIVQAMVDIARSLDLLSVAEGVESQPQLDFLRRLGCDQVQGFLHGPPMTAADFLSHWRGQADAAGPAA